MQILDLKALTKKTLNKVKTFGRDLDGNFSTVLAVSIVPLVVAAGAAIDYSQIVSDKQKAQHAVDSASLAAASNYYSEFRTGTANEAGDELFLVNLNDSSIIENSDFQTQSERLSNGGIRFKSSIEGTTQHAFMGIVGNHETKWNAVSTAEVSAPPQIEIMLVLDVSDSMRDNNKLDNLKGALNQFITDVNPYSLGDSHIAITLIPYSENVSFGSKAKVWLDPVTGFDHAPSFEGCFRHDDDTLRAGEFQASIVARAPGRRQSPTCPKSIGQAVLFSTNGDDLKEHVNQIDTSRGTNTTTGLLWAERFLTNQWRIDAEFSPSKPENITDATQKIIVLLTDGEITIVDTDQNGELDSRQSPRPADESFIDSQTLPNFRTKCEALRQVSNLKVYSIGFDLKDGATSDALRGCVSGGGAYFDAGIDDLNAVFANISGAVLPIRIVD